MADCIFCEIASGRAPARLVFEDDQVVAFEDIEPRAPVHVLVVPRKHLADAREATQDGLLPRLFEAAHTVAADRGVAGSGYRLVSTWAPTPARPSTTPTSTSLADGP
jgi:histidine triad (HIT) family protein